MRRYTKTLAKRNGSELAWSKLNETLVKRIREEHAQKEAEIKRLNAEYSAKAFASRYQVSKQAIDKVLSYQTWRHVR